MLFKDKLLDLFLKAPSKNKKSDGDDVFLVDKLPPEGFLLRTRKVGGCAQYSLKAVIEGKKNIKNPIQRYSADWRSRTTYLMVPWGIKRVLKKYKLKYEVLNAKKLSDDEKLNLLRNNLRKGPIILLIANGQTRKKRFSWGKALTHWHYVTLWGYDDKNQFFYVYDSNTKRKTQQHLMKGTLKIPYKYILKERGIGASKLIYDYAIAIKY